MAPLRSQPSDPTKDTIDERLSATRTLPFTASAASATIVLPGSGNISSEASPMMLSTKRGIAYNNAKLANVFSDSCETCSWGYNWDSTPQGLAPNLTFIPTLWGALPTHTSHWHVDAENAIANGAKALFSFNEPDNAGQANMSPEAAASAHIKHFSNYAGRARIGAPSITNAEAATQGLGWLKSFMNACRGECPVDFCNVHWYAGAEQAGSLFDHLDGAHDVCGGKPIWLTEFAVLSGDSISFIQNVLPKLESLPHLEAYSYYMVSTSSLMASEKVLSGTGELYAKI
ncbi:transposase [Purpureocillium lavendulum]|uniref:Transposase n=1 Tax=Purpureocillium lavendulum TaxID=1247861 RepID=A0AB34FDX5_9HYPO|nr:transposase [Purpureocillium lavendulum]